MINVYKCSLTMTLPLRGIIKVKVNQFDDFKCNLFSMGIIKIMRYSVPKVGNLF